MNDTVVTIRTLARRKQAREPISMVTAYDYLFALLAEEAGIDAILVGDSLGVVVQGRRDTLSVTLDEVIYHTRCVTRAARRALVIADMPFASYRVSPDDTVRNACRIIQEGRAAAVKLEGGVAMAETIRRLTAVGIPVLGHVGMLPSHLHESGFGLQGRDAASMRRILDDARAVEQAGAFAIVVENVVAALARALTERASVPTIGIGAGPDCDGQVLVLHDMLGLSGEQAPPFARRYAALGDQARHALVSYRRDVVTRSFPSAAETRDLDAASLDVLTSVLAEQT